MDFDSFFLSFKSKDVLIHIEKQIIILVWVTMEIMRYSQIGLKMLLITFKRKVLEVFRLKNYVNL